MRHSTHGRLHSGAPKTTPQANYTSLPSSPLASTSITKNVTSLHCHTACTIWRVVCNIQHDTKVRLYTLCLITIAHHSALYAAQFGLVSPCDRKQFIMPPPACLLLAPALCIPSFPQQRADAPRRSWAMRKSCLVSHAPSHRPGPPTYNLLPKPGSYCPTPKITFVCIPHPPGSADLLLALAAVTAVTASTAGASLAHSAPHTDVHHAHMLPCSSYCLA